MNHLTPSHWQLSHMPHAGLNLIFSAVVTHTHTLTHTQSPTPIRTHRVVSTPSDHYDIEAGPSKKGHNKDEDDNTIMKAFFTYGSLMLHLILACFTLLGMYTMKPRYQSVLRGEQLR